MNRTRARRRTRERRRSRVLLGMFVLVLVAGVIAQITMYARLAGQHKELLAVEKEIRSLSASADNLNLSLNQYHNLDRIAARAAQMGMDKPADTQIRVVNLPGVIENTSTQSAEAVGAEEMLQ